MRGRGARRLSSRTSQGRRIGNLFPLLFALLPAPPQGQLPLTQLRAAYPYGDQLCIEATPDNQRAFVALGSAISILDVSTLSGGTPAVIDRIEMPSTSPISMLYVEHEFNPGSPDVLPPTRRWLFIAGGRHGLQSLKLCPNVFDSQPSVCADYDPTTVDDVEPAGSFMSKRCIDLAFVADPLPTLHTGPLLFALYAASSLSTKSPIGPSELRAYALQSNGSVDPTPVATFLLDDIDPAGHAHPDPVATALAADPGDPTSLYVAMGTAWLYRVDIATTAFTMTQVPPVPSCLQTSCPQGESMRDLALARTVATGPILYASLDYGRVIEYEFLNGTYATINTPCGFPDRIAAATDGVSMIGVAVEIRQLPAISIETEAPYGNWGSWIGSCFGYWGLTDPNNPIRPQCSPAGPQIRFYTRGANPNCPLTLGRVLPVARDFNGSIALRPDAAGGFRSYESRNGGGTIIRRLTFDQFGGGASGSSSSDASAGPGSGIPIDPCPLNVMQTQVLAEYRDRQFPASDGEFSLLNPGVFFSALDGIGGGAVEGGMLYVTPSPNVDVVAVPQTLSVCPGQPPIPNISCFQKDGDPNPFLGGLFGQAHWTDPVDPLKEWYLVGHNVWRKATGGCAFLGQCTTICAGTIVYFLQGGFDADDASTGWKLVSVKPGSYGASPPQGGNMDMHWWQFPAPRESDEDLRTSSTPYFWSMFDPEDGLVYATRGGSRDGLKVFGEQMLREASTQTCLGTGNNGQGEDLRDGFTGDWYVEAMTHVEMEDPDGSGPGDPCKPILNCELEVATGPRHLFNGRCAIFEVLDPTTSTMRKVIAVAAGSVTAEPGSDQPPSCQWTPHAGLLQVSIFDIEGLAGTFPNPAFPPVLLRVALGDERGMAMGVVTRHYPSTGKTYAFVADMCGPDLGGTDVSGRLLVFDVSGSNLFPAAGSPYLPPGNPNPPWGFLRPVPSTTLVFPRDPVDGLGTNVIDIEIDPDPDTPFVYCALGEGGVAVVDVSDPTNPFIVEILDAPGIAFGISFRADATEGDQMMVGSPRAGVQVFKR